MAEYIKTQFRLLYGFSRYLRHIAALLADHNIKHHVRRHDLDIRLIQPLMLRSVDTGFKIHPFMEIVLVPAAFGVPAGILTHGDFVPDRRFIIFFLLRHIAPHGVVIGDCRTVISDFNGIPAPGNLIKLLAHRRLGDIFILGRVQPPNGPARGAVVPNALRLDTRNIPDKVLSENKFRIQGPRAVGKRQDLKGNRRFLRSRLPDRIRRFLAALGSLRRHLLDRFDGPRLNFRIIRHPCEFRPAVVLHPLYDIRAGIRGGDFRVKLRIMHLGRQL